MKNKTIQKLYKEKERKKNQQLPPIVQSIKFKESKHAIEGREGEWNELPRI